MSLSVSRERAASASALEEIRVNKEFEGCWKSLRRAETVDVHSTSDGKATRSNGQACPWVSPGLSTRALY